LIACARWRGENVLVVREDEFEHSDEGVASILHVRKKTKKTCQAGYTGIELFDLEKVLGEKNNIAKTHPDIVEQLSKQLRDWQGGGMNSLMGRDYKE